MFDILSIKFLQKYEQSTEEIANFLKYFKKQWLEELRYWYEGAARDAPSTNNALESYNRNIKVLGTLREQLPLKEFIDQFFIFIFFTSFKTKEGEEYAFEKDIRISNELWIAGINFYHQIKENFIMNKTIYYYNRKDNIFLDFYPNIEIFDSIVEIRKDYLIFEITDCKCYCSCYSFLKDKICKHSLGISIILNFINCPVDINIYKLPNQRTKGRTEKAKKALVRSNKEYVF